MDESSVLELATRGIWTTALLCAPILLTALLVGLLVSLLQGLTQLQDQTLSFVPKFIGVGLALILSATWMIQTIISFTRNAFELLPILLG
jgi:flagellar biosynthetic protein FliQ